MNVAIDVVVKQERSFFAQLGCVSPQEQILGLAVQTVLTWAGESLFENLDRSCDVTRRCGCGPTCPWTFLDGTQSMKQQRQDTSPPATAAEEK